MITVKARINITDSKNGNVQNITASHAGINISSTINYVKNKRGSSIGNPFILGKNILGTGATYANNLPYYISHFISNEEGAFRNTLTIYVIGKNIYGCIVVFDKENNKHPNSIEVDGITFQDDDAQFEITFDENIENHTIRINNWNTPYEPLILTGIYFDVNINIDEKNIVSFKSNIMDRENNRYPSYGIISNTANLNFADFDMEVLDFIKQEILHSGITVTTWLENDNTNNKEQICEMEIQDLKYDNYNRQIQLSLKDNLEDWQNINVPEIGYSFNEEAKTAKWYFEYLYEITDEIGKYNIPNFSQLDSETRYVLENTEIEYPILKSGNLWDCWSRLCQLCLLHIYIDNNNKVVIKFGL